MLLLIIMCLFEAFLLVFIKKVTNIEFVHTLKKHHNTLAELNLIYRRNFVFILNHLYIFRKMFYFK